MMRRFCFATLTISSVICAGCSRTSKDDRSTDDAIAASRLAVIEAVRSEAREERVTDGWDAAWQIQGDVGKGMSECDEAIRANPKDARAFVDRGNAWMRVQSFNKAIKDYDAAIALDAGNRTAYFNRGIGCGQKGDLDGAIKDFTEAIRLDPNDGTALKARAAAWQIKGEVAEFTEHENEKSRARHGGNPSKDSPPAPKRLDDYDNAIKDDSDAIRLDPKYVAGFLGRGVAWDAKENSIGAISDLTAAIQLDPKNTIGYTIRGYVYACATTTTTRSKT